MASTTLTFDILAKDRASKTFKGVGRSADGLGSKLKSTGKIAAVALGGAAVVGVAAFGKALVSSVQSLARIEKINAQTGAAIKSTGGAAGVTAKHVEALAGQIESLTASEAESVQEGANLLLTFTNIQNKAGKGNQIFDQATRIMNDMSVALGQDTKSSAIQLGKALNDPIKGLTALQRVGVSFTAAQKTQIRTLQESGNTMGAQKVILAELTKEFGGSGEAFAKTTQGKFELARHKLGEVGETIFAELLPPIANLAVWFTSKLPAALKVGQRIFAEVKGGVVAFGAAWKSNNGQITSSGFPGFMERAGFAARQAFAVFKTDVLPRLRDFAGFITKSAIPAITGLAKWLARNRDVVIPLAAGIATAVVVFKTVTAVTKAWAVAQAALNVVLMLNPIGLVIAAIAGLAIGLVVAYKKSETFRKVVDGAFGAVKKAVSSVVGFFKDLPGDISKAVGDTSRTLLGKGKSFIFGLVSGVVAYLRFIGGIGAWVLRNVVTPVVDVFAKAGQWLLGAGRLVVSGLVAGFLAYLKAISGVGRWLLDNVALPAIRAFGKAGEWLVNAGKNVLGGFWSGLTEKWEAVKKWVGGIATWIKDHKGPVSLDGRLLIPAGKAIMSGFLKGLQSGAGPAWNFVESVGGKSVDALRNLFGGNELVIPQGISGNVGGLARGTFRGKSFNRRTALMILEAEKRLGEQFAIMQGGWMPATPWSGTTHTGGGVADFNGPGGWDRAVAALRAVGFAAWHRTPAQGPWGHHIHAVAIGDPTASASARAQVESYKRGGIGLAGYKHGTPWVPNDQLAFLHKGEAVVPAEVNRARLSGSGGEIHIHLHGTEQQLMNQLTRKLDELRRQGRVRL